jgi:hypothetical protein
MKRTREGAITALCIAAVAFSISCATAEEKARTLFNQAQALQRHGKGEEARKLLERVVNEYPQTQVATEANKELSRENFRLPHSKPVSAVLDALETSQMSANEGSAHASMRTLGSGQLLRRSTKGEFGTPEELEKDKIIDSRLASGSKSGYRFETRPGPKGFAIQRICNSLP